MPSTELVLDVRGRALAADRVVPVVLAAIGVRRKERLITGSERSSTDQRHHRNGAPPDPVPPIVVTSRPAQSCPRSLSPVEPKNSVPPRGRGGTPEKRGGLEENRTCVSTHRYESGSHQVRARDVVWGARYSPQSRSLNVRVVSTPGFEGPDEQIEVLAVHKGVVVDVRPWRARVERRGEGVEIVAVNPAVAVEVGAAGVLGS